MKPKTSFAHPNAIWIPILLKDFHLRYLATVLFLVAAVESGSLCRCIGHSLSVVSRMAQMSLVSRTNCEDLILRLITNTHVMMATLPIHLVSIP